MAAGDSLLVEAAMAAAPGAAAGQAVVAGATTEATGVFGEATN